MPELGGTRPDQLMEVRSQEWDQRRTVEQIVDDSSLVVPSLDVPVPQMESQLVEMCRQLDIHFPEQAIEVPKISSSPRHSRRRRVPLVQTAEQLVEVPAIVSYSSLHGLVEQNVDIPVPHGSGRRRRFSRFYAQGQKSTACLGADHVDIPDPREGLQGSRHGQGSTASSSHAPGLLRMRLYCDFSHFFHKNKKCTCRCESECEGARALELIRVECSSNFLYR